MVRPYLGLGGGLNWVNQGDRGTISGAWHLALGTRWPLSSLWFLHTGGRVRSTEPIAEATLGIDFRLP